VLYFRSNRGSLLFWGGFYRSRSAGEDFFELGRTAEKFDKTKQANPSKSYEPRIKVCTDRILPKDLMRLQSTIRTREGGQRAIAPIGKTWMNGSTLQVRFMSGSSAQQDIAREQADWWAQLANLKFDFNNARKRTPRKPHFASEHDGPSLFGNVIPGVLHTVDLQPFAIQERDDAALVAQLDRGTGQGQ